MYLHILCPGLSLPGAEGEHAQHNFIFGCDQTTHPLFAFFQPRQIYKYYFTSETMVTLNVRQLKKTYQIYDEPRLLIAGES